MEQYNDDERVEDLKKWWADNGASVIIGILLGLAAIFGWQYWSAYRDAQAEKASQAYDTFVKAADRPDAAQAAQYGQSVLNDFPKSSYAALTALRLAKLAMDGGDAAMAATRLEWVIGNAKLDELKDIARLRLAKVRFAAAQPAEAHKLLESITAVGLTAEREALKGDLYLAGNDVEKARSAYATALAASGGGDRLLQLKLDNLAAPTSESLIPTPAAPPPVASEPAKPEEKPVEIAPVPAVAEPIAEPAKPEEKPVETVSVPAAAEPATEPAKSEEKPVEIAPVLDRADEPAVEPTPSSIPNDGGSAPIPVTPAPTSGQ